jgi:hypothetical protein
LKREPTIVTRSLRAVGLAITLVSIVTFSTIGYTVFADAQAFLGSLQSGPGHTISSAYRFQGSNLLLDLNATVQNQGLYPLSITLSCSPVQQEGVSCSSAQATIPPGQTSTLVFRIMVPNATEYTNAVQSPKQLHINGTATFALEPFASITINSDYGNLFRFGGS